MYRVDIIAPINLYSLSKMYYIQEKEKESSIRSANRFNRSLQLTAFSPALKPEEQKACTPMIYICATMWHESPDEMRTMLKSVYK